MNRFKKVASSLLAAVLMVGTVATPALAAKRDITDLTTGESFLYESYIWDDNAIFDIIDKLEKDPENFVMEFNQANYKYSDLVKEIVENGKTLEEALKVVKPVTDEEDLKVVEVSAIDKTVKLNVAALEPAEGAKAKVVIFKLDDKGEKATTLKTVAAAEIEENVVTVDLSAETVGDADYAFVVTVGENEAEVIETLAFKAVEELVTKINNATAAQLATLLNNDEYFTGFDIAKVDAYYTAKGAVATYKTIAEVQENVIDAAAEVTAFEAFADEMDEIKGLFAKYTFLKETFQFVDDANMDDYMSTAGPIFKASNLVDRTSVTSFEDVQKKIDQINLNKVATKAVETDGSEKLSDLNEYKAALEALQLVNEDLVAAAPASLTKAKLIEAIDAELKKIADAKEIAGKAIAKAETAMDNYEAALDRDVDKDNSADDAYFDVADAIEALQTVLADKDVTENAIKAFGDKDTIKVGTPTPADVIAPLVAATDEITIVQDALAALEAYETVRGDDFNAADTNYKAVIDEFTDYANDDLSLKNPVATMKGLVKTLNDETAQWTTYYAVMATEDAATMRDLLFDFEEDAYIDLSAAQKLEFAERFIVELDDEANYGAVKGLLSSELTAYAKLIDDVNEANTISGMRDALEAVSEDYDALGAQAKADIAEAMLTKTPFATIADIEAAMGL